MMWPGTCGAAPLDQALLVLGVATGPYVDNPVKGGETYVSAMHLTQLQEKAQ